MKDKIKCCICGLEERFIGDIILLKNELPVCSNCNKNFKKYTALCKCKIHSKNHIEFVSYSMWIDKFEAVKRFNLEEPKRVIIFSEENWNNIFNNLKEIENENSKSVG